MNTRGFPSSACSPMTLAKRNCSSFFFSSTFFSLLPEIRYQQFLIQGKPSVTVISFIHWSILRFFVFLLSLTLLNLSLLSMISDTTRISFLKTIFTWACCFVFSLEQSSPPCLFPDSLLLSWLQDIVTWLCHSQEAVISPMSQCFFCICPYLPWPLLVSAQPFLFITCLLMISHFSLFVSNKLFFFDE